MILQNIIFVLKVWWCHSWDCDHICNLMLRAKRFTVNVKCNNITVSFHFSLFQHFIIVNILHSLELFNVIMADYNITTIVLGRQPIACEDCLLLYRHCLSSAVLLTVRFNITRKAHKAQWSQHRISIWQVRDLRMAWFAAKNVFHLCLRRT